MASSTTTLECTERIPPARNALALLSAQAHHDAVMRETAIRRSLQFWTITCCAPLVIALGLIESGSSCVCAKGGQATAAVTGQNEPRELSASEFPQRLLRADIENLFRLGTRLYSGGEPEGEAAFAQLQSPASRSSSAWTDRNPTSKPPGGDTRVPHFQPNRPAPTSRFTPARIPSCSRRKTRARACRRAWT